MQVTETKTEGLKREFTILVPAATIEEKVTARLEQIGETASIPGFRPGKVPMSFLTKRYRGAVMGEVLDAMINESTAQAVKERDLRPAIQPKIEIVSFDDGKDLEFSVAMEVLPEIKIGDLSTISLERLKGDRSGGRRRKGDGKPRRPARPCASDLGKASGGEG